MKRIIELILEFIFKSYEFALSGPSSGWELLKYYASNPRYLLGFMAIFATFLTALTFMFFLLERHQSKLVFNQDAGRAYLVAHGEPALPNGKEN